MRRLTFFALRHVSNESQNYDMLFSVCDTSRTRVIKNGWLRAHLRSGSGCGESASGVSDPLGAAVGMELAPTSAGYRAVGRYTHAAMNMKSHERLLKETITDVIL